MKNSRQMISNCVATKCCASRCCLHLLPLSTAAQNFARGLDTRRASMWANVISIEIEMERLFDSCERTTTEKDAIETNVNF